MEETARITLLPASKTVLGEETQDTAKYRVSTRKQGKATSNAAKGLTQS